MKYGKKIIDQQAHLERVADCIIDLTAATAATSRAAKAIAEGSSTAEHEADLANAFALEAIERIRGNVKNFSTDSVKSLDKYRVSVADSVFEEGGYHAKHPIGF